MKIYNAFGITPTNTYVSAGTDYYIPNIDTDEKKLLAYKAFEKSYGKTEEEIKELDYLFEVIFNINNQNNFIKFIPNLVHLYLALYDPNLENIKQTNTFESINLFLNEFAIHDEINDKIGIKVNLNDTLFINSGIKIALDTVLSDQSNKLILELRNLGIGVAGLYVNKSGMGNRGWDVRACLVDEDYSGYVHLSQAFTKETINSNQNIIYCGDKLTQMMLIPVFHTQYIETDETKYNAIMSQSLRGDSGFGSSDVKH